MKKELKKGNNERIAKLKTVVQDALDNGCKPNPAVKGSDLVASIEQSKKLQSRTSQTDYKADNSRLNEEINKLNAIIALRDRSIEDYRDELDFAKISIEKQKDIVANRDLKILDLEDKLQTCSDRFNGLKSTQDETIKDYHAMASTATERLEQLEKLQSKWYVKLFGR